MKIETIRLIVSEVDGILTDGLIPYDALGNVPFKNFKDPEFDIINKIKPDFDVVFMSRSSDISYNLLRKKNLPFFWAKKSKLETLKHIMLRYSVTPDEVIYLDGESHDEDCFNLIPFSKRGGNHAYNFRLLYNNELKKEVIRRNLCL